MKRIVLWMQCEVLRRSFFLLRRKNATSLLASYFAIRADNKARKFINFYKRRLHTPEEGKDAGSCIRLYLHDLLTQLALKCFKLVEACACSQKVFFHAYWGQSSMTSAILFRSFSLTLLTFTSLK